MKIKHLTLFVILVLCVSGCALARSSVAIHDVVLLPEERIFTVPQGQLISVELDGKPMQMTFPHPMKLVYESVLVRQEEKLNNQIKKSAKTEKEKADLMKMAGSAIGALGSILWIVARRKKAFKLDAGLKAEA